MPVNHNIGALRRAVEYANKVPSLINTNPIVDPYIPFNSELLSALSGKADDPNSIGMFIWGVDTWGDTTKKVTKS
jgi:hypothetical protein